VDFASGVTADRVEKVIAEIDREFKQENPFVKRVFIEAEARSKSSKE